jgi:hypothetical protein
MGFINPGHDLPPGKGIGEHISMKWISKQGKLSTGMKGKLTRGQSDKSKAEPPLTLPLFSSTTGCIVVLDDKPSFSP